MPGPLVHVSATIICAHAAPVNAISSNTQVFVSGMPVVTLMDTFAVPPGCPFTLPTVPPKPQPCVRVQWLVPATRVFVRAQPVILQASAGLCFSAEQIPQGPPTVVTTQPRVSGM
jgi:hypothetical protein